MNKQRVFIMVYDLVSHLVISSVFLWGLGLGTILPWSFLISVVGISLVTLHLASYGRFLSYCDGSSSKADPFKRVCQVSSYGSYLCFIAFLINTIRGLFVL